MLFILCLLGACYSGSVIAQGQFAGTKKGLLGKEFTDHNKNSLLKGYSWHQGDLISGKDDVPSQFLTIYFKGGDAIIVYSVQKLQSAEAYQVADLIELKQLPAGLDIRTAGCSEGNTEGQIIIALVKPGNKNYATVVKAWRCNRDKLRIEPLNIKSIRCMNEDGD